MTRRPPMPPDGNIRRAHQRMAPGGRLWSESPVRGPAPRVVTAGDDPPPPDPILPDWAYVTAGEDGLADDVAAVQANELSLSVYAGSDLDDLTPPAGWSLLAAGSNVAAGGTARYAVAGCTGAVAAGAWSPAYGTGNAYGRTGVQWTFGFTEPLNLAWVTPVVSAYTGSLTKPDAWEWSVTSPWQTPPAGWAMRMQAITATGIGLITTTSTPVSPATTWGNGVAYSPGVGYDVDSFTVDPPQSGSIDWTGQIASSYPDAPPAVAWSFAFGAEAV